MSERFEMRVPVELLARLDVARGFEPRASFVKRALEAALSEAKGPLLGKRAGPGPVGSSEPVRPAASPRAHVEDSLVEGTPLPKIAKRKW